MRWDVGARVGRGRAKPRTDRPYQSVQGGATLAKKEPLRKRFGGFTCRNLRWNRWGGARDDRAHSRARIRRRTTENPAIPTTALGRPIPIFERLDVRDARLPPLRDRSNDATPTPVAKSAVPARGHPHASKAPAAAAVARSPLSALNGSTAARRNTPINAKENKKLAAAAGKPMVFDQAVLSSPAGNKLRKIQGDNDNLRELNRKLWSSSAPPASPPRRRPTPPPSPRARALDGEQLQRLNEENSALRSLNTKILVHLKTAQQSARESADVVAQARDQRAEALEKLSSANEESTKLRDLNNRFIKELRSAREATAKATAAVAAANVKAGDIHEQMDAANEQNARLRELNQRFAAEIKSSRKAAGDAESDASDPRRRLPSLRAAKARTRSSSASTRALRRTRRRQQGDRGGARGGAEKATAGEEMVRLSGEENAKLRDVNVQLIAALKNAQREAKEAASAIEAAEARARRASGDGETLRTLNSKLVAELRTARANAKEAQKSSEVPPPQPPRTRCSPRRWTSART